MPLTLAEVVREQARKQPEAVAITCAGTSTTWADLDRRSSLLAGALKASGVEAGARVGLLMKNNPIFMEAFFACNKIGAIAVGLNWRLKSAELAEIVADADPRVILVDEEHRGLVDNLPACGAAPRVVMLGAGYEDWLVDNGAGEEVESPGLDDAALILYSSGTSGKPKGVVLTNRNMSFIEPMATRLFRMTPRSVYLLGSPLFHIGGAATGTALMTLGGRTVLLVDADPNDILDTIERERVTHAFFVPAVIQRLVETQEASPRDLSSLELLAYGAAPMNGTLLRRAMEVLGCGFLGCYGMTETSGTVTALFPEEHHPDGSGQRLLQSVGRALPWAEIKLVDPTSGVEAKPGEFGEIWIKSEANAAGYFNNPQASADARGEDGWLKTGDGAVRDEAGYIFLKDRIKDMVITGGENVYPMEVENVLAAHPDISEVAVIGVPDERWGETIKAVAVPRAGTAPEAPEIIQFCRAKIAHYKCPTSVELVDELPRTATGKVLKTLLRQRYSGA